METIYNTVSKYVSVYVYCDYECVHVQNIT